MVISPYYAPNIQDTLHSIKFHMKYLHCNFKVEDNKTILTYPGITFTLDTIDEVRLLIFPTPVQSIIPTSINTPCRVEWLTYAKVCYLMQITARLKSINRFVPSSISTILITIIPSNSSLLY